MYKRSKTSKLKTKERQRQRESKYLMRYFADEHSFDSKKVKGKRCYKTADGYVFNENDVEF